MKRERQVYPRDMVAHLWANRSQDSAREPSRNFWFTGAALWSYGSHYVVGFHMPEGYSVDGRRVVLMNSYRASMTTGKHMDAARSAIRGHDVHVVNVPGMRDSDVAPIHRAGASTIVDTLEKAARSALRDAAKPRIRPDTIASHVRIASRFLADARALAACDKARKELAKENRAKASALLKAWPAELPQDRAGVQALNATLNRAELIANAERWTEKALKAARDYEYQRVTCRNVEQAHESAERVAAGYGLAAQDFKSANVAGRARWCLTLQKQWNAKRAECAAEIAAENAQRAARVIRTTADELAAGVPFASAYAGATLAEGINGRLWWRAQKDDAGAVAISADLIEHARDMVKACGNVGACPADTVDALRTFADALEACNVEFLASRLSRLVSHARNVAQEARDMIEKKNAGSALRRVETVALDIRAALDVRVPHELDDAAHAMLRELDTLARRAQDAIEEEEKDKREAWRAGSLNWFRFSLADGGAALRVLGDKIETSQGAFVPLSVAPFVWRAVLHVRATGAAQEFAGDDAPRLGHFTLRRIAANGDITVGCHFIPFDELAKVADVLGYAREEVAA